MVNLTSYLLLNRFLYSSKSGITIEGRKAFFFAGGRDIDKYVASVFAVTVNTGYSTFL